MKVIAALFLVFSLFAAVATAQSKSFKCNSTATCQALIDYIPPNATTVLDIQTLFGVKNFRSILGANLMFLNTLLNQTVPAKRAIKIPFPCSCKNGTGISKNRPIYKVKPGDGLDHIARDIFAGLMTFQQIADVNKIPNPDKIEVGQELKIPLPCSCDDVDGVKVVHYGYVVPDGSSVQGIANQFGTTQDTLLKLNGMADPNTLLAGSVLDIPLKACTSVVSTTSPDYPLLVPNGTITFTANNCVQCKCDSANNWTLHCEPSPKDLVKVPNWSQCPSMLCQGTENLSLGNTSSSGCPRTSCAYAGYDKKNINTTLINDPTCSPGGGSSPSGNYATKNSLHGRSWRWLSLWLGLLGFGLLS